MAFRAFEPDKDEGKPLFEIQSRDAMVDGEKAIATVFVPSEYSYDEAREMPWHFVVEAADGDLV